MSEAVKVVVRCRPFSVKEKEANHTCVVTTNAEEASISIVNPAQSGSLNGGSTQASSTQNSSTDPIAKKYTFDSVFGAESTQTDVYNLTARPIVESVLEGYNGTIFAYGQTGTGKTFTMEGVRENSELRGIIPNAIHHIFQHISSSHGENFLVRASYLEIYNEEIRDLLAAKVQALEMKERTDVGVYVKNLQSFVIKDISEMDRLMAYGNKNRSVGSTLMNERSSRSHSLFTITVEASSEDSAGVMRIRAGKLHLVDLAGSERQSKTGATGDRLKEASKINLSLSALGNVISALVDGKSKHIPYRDSKLTRLLQDSLGGNAKTLMIATLSPASYNFDESVSTLRYANRAKNIKNKPTINEDPKDALLRQFQEEIQLLRTQLAALDHSNPIENEQENHSESHMESHKEYNKEALSKAQAQFSKEKEDIMKQLAQEKEDIIKSKTMEEGEKQLLLQKLAQKETEIAAERDERNQLAKQLKQLEKQLLVGDENLLDKEAEQRDLLAKQALELEERKRKERELQRKLDDTEVSKLQISENYSTLQEEALAKTKKLKKLWTLLTHARQEVSDLTEENQREREDLLDTLRALRREINLCTLVMDSIIPASYQTMIENAASYDDNSESWHIAHIAHAGNNLHGKKSQLSGKWVALRESAKQSTTHSSSSSRSPTAFHSSNNDLADENWSTLPIFPNVYLNYDDPKLNKKLDSLRSIKETHTHTSPSPQPMSPLKRPPSASTSPRKDSASKQSSPIKQLPSSDIPQARGLVQKPVRYA